MWLLSMPDLISSGATVLGAVLPIFGLIGAGYACGKRALLGPGATDALNKFVIWLALPALLFKAMAEATARDLDHPDFVIACAGGIAVTFLLAFVTSPRGAERRAEASLVSLAAAYANTGFIGIPLCVMVFGDRGLPAAVISTLLTVSVLFGIAIVLVESSLHRGLSVLRTVARVLLSLVKNPLIFAPLLGAAFAVTHAPLPAALARFTGLLSGAASPCALVTIGLFLSEARASAERSTVLRIVGLKMIVHPVATAIFAFGVFRMQPLWSHSVLLLSALPTGTGPFMLAKLYEREAAVISRAILITTLLSLLSISVLVAWFAHA